MVLVIGVLGNGFFGAGIRAVQEREQNILRRFKVAPISPIPILGASLTTGLLLFIPSILLTFALARTLYGMTCRRAGFLPWSFWRLARWRSARSV